MRPLCAVVALCIGFSLTAAAQFAGNDSNGGRPKTFERQPLAFEVNRGQSDGAVRFFARGATYSIFVTKDEVVFALQDREPGATKAVRAVMRLQFAGSAGARVVEGVDPLPGVSNYYRGRKPSGWLLNVQRFEKVRLADIYPGIDLVCYGNDGQLEYDLVVHPGADPSQIRLRSVGTRNLRIEPGTGDLVADAERGTIRHKSPAVYEELAPSRRALPASYRINEEGEIGFQVAGHDLERTMVIDPVIVWSTLHGGNDVDAGFGIATDGTGAAYVAGYTSSTNFPVANAEQPTNASNYTTDYFDVFVSKFNAGGQSLAYSTYLGGELDDYGIAIALDSGGAVYVTGRTESLLTFPTTAGAYQTANNGGLFDAFVFKLDAAGQLAYSTYVGGSDHDGGEGIAVDAAGNAYVGGFTWSLPGDSTAFPSTAQLGPGGGVQDGFALKLNATGTALTYSALVGGSADETMEAIDIDSAGNAYIIGRTQSNDFPMVLPVQGTRAGGYDATMSRINAAGTALDYSTYLGGDQDDLGIAIEVDDAGNAYGTGHSFKPTSTPFPTTPGAFQAVNYGLFDVFITKLTPAGAYAYSTLLGAPFATSDDNSYGIGVDSKGNATFAGFTTAAGTRDVFLAKLNSAGTAQVYGTLVQGSAEDQGRDLDFDQNGYAFITGFTTSANFGAPLVNPRPGQGPHAGPSSAFVVVMTDSVNLAVTKTDGNTTAAPGANVTYSIVVTNSGPTAATGVTVTDTFPAQLTSITWTAATGAPAATGFDAAGSGNINDTGITMPVGSTLTYTVTATILTGATGTISNTATATESPDVIDTNTANNSATDTTILAGDLVITKVATDDTLSPGEAVQYTITVTNSGPASVSGVTVADTFPAALTGVTWTATTGAPAATGFDPAGSGDINDTGITLPVGSFVTYVVNTVIASSTTGATLDNTATVTAPAGFDTNLADNSDTETITLSPSADLSITKTDNATSATPGGPITYTITVTNDGPANVTGASVTDDFDDTRLSGVSSTVVQTNATGAMPGSGDISQIVDIDAGGSIVYTVTATIPSDATGTLSNTAEVSHASDTTPANNSATDTTTLVASGDLGITKTATDNTLSPGDPVQYTIVVINSGPSAVVDATVADIFPSALTDVTWTASTGAPAATDFDVAGSGNINDSGIALPVGGSVTYVVDATISPLAAGPTLDNTATVGLPEDGTDPDPANNSDLETITLVPLADLSITKTDNATGATPGGPITYTIVVSNAGPAGVIAATVVDNFPADLSGVTYTATSVTGASGFTAAGSGNINDTVNLPSGSSITYMATATINPSAAADLVNTATVTPPAGVSDPDSSDNSATDTDSLAPLADLSASKSGSPDPVAPAGQIVYAIAITNDGPADATTVTLTDVLPAGTTFAAIQQNSGPTFLCVVPPASAATVTCSIATLASGASATFSLTVNAVNPGTTVTNSVVAASTTPDGDTNNNTATTATTVLPGPDVSGTKSVTSPGPHVTGAQVQYTIVLTNSSVTTQPDNPENELVDVLPAGLTLAGVTSSSGTATATIGTNTVIWNGSIAQGSPVTITITATIVAPSGAVITNQGTILYDPNLHGANDQSRSTDDPSVGGPGNATDFTVGALQANIPVGGPLGMALMVALLALSGLLLTRKG